MFRSCGVLAVSLSPRVALSGPDVIADLMDAQGFFVEYVLPLVDCAVSTADILNSRLGRPANDPVTSDLRRDKYAQQEALRAAGLSAVAQCLVSDPDSAASFASKHFAAASEARGIDPQSSAELAAVVVKPRDASGGDGIWLCTTEAQVRTAVTEELGRQNVEGAVNSELVIMEALVGEEWVVNTVTRDGIHKVTDVWRGPHKVSQAGGNRGPAQFLYTEQFLASESERRSAMLSFCCAVLDALGFHCGAAHTELIWTAHGPRLLEVNARPAGGLPRTPTKPNQLEALAMGLFEPERFAALPVAPPEADDASAAVVFLRAPMDGWLLGSALEAMTLLSTFHRFDRDLLGLKGPGLRSVRVRRTMGLFSSPGALVLQGNVAAVEADVENIRRIEETGYAAEPAEHLLPGRRSRSR